MTLYRWQGIEGAQHAEGEIAAATMAEAKKQLLARKVILTQLAPVAAPKAKGKKKEAAIRETYKPRKIKGKELMIFSKKFATMIQAGLPILKTIRMLENQADNPHFKSVIHKIYIDVESGGTLSDAFAKHPRVFDSIYVNLLRAGETSGKLTLFLRRLVVQIEKAQKLKSKVRGALMYPIILMVVALAVILLMLIKVVPVFQKMFASMGHDLPGPTQFIVNVSEFFRNPAQGGVLILAILGLIFGARYLIAHNRKCRRKFHEILLKTPLLGLIIQKSTLSKIAMIHGNLSAAGVSILEAIDIIASTVRNLVYQEAFEYIKGGVAEGKPLSALYGECAIFPPSFSQMIAVGEETGNMDEMFDSIARYFEEEFDMAVDAFTEMLEPFMIVFMGITVGFIIIAMYMPIFQVGKMVSGGN